MKIDIKIDGGIEGYCYKLTSGYRLPSIKVNAYDVLELIKNYEINAKTTKIRVEKIKFIERVLEFNIKIFGDTTISEH